MNSAILGQHFLQKQAKKEAAARLSERELDKTRDRRECAGPAVKVQAYEGRATARTGVSILALPALQLAFTEKRACLTTYPTCFVE